MNKIRVALLIVFLVSRLANSGIALAQASAPSIPPDQCTLKLSVAQ